MKIFEIEGRSPGDSFNDHVVTNKISELDGIVKERYGRGAITFNAKEVSIEKVRVDKLTVGDLMRLINK